MGMEETRRGKEEQEVGMEETRRYKREIGSRNGGN